MDIETTGQTERSEPQAGTEPDEAALDLVKQLITLAAGVLALSATFIEKIGHPPWGLLVIIAASWLALIISVYCGLQSMSVIVKSRLTRSNEWSEGKGRNYARISKYGFVSGITLFALFALLLVATSKPDAAPSAQVHGRPCPQADQ